MSIKPTIIAICCLLSLTTLGQNGFLKSSVYLEEKQNKPAAAIPKILLEAYSKGDITAYYPKNLEKQVSYAQFLNHFGMESKAYQVIADDTPDWFCHDGPVVQVDAMVIDCMQYAFEIGERSVRNNVTYQQEIKLAYVKLIYSGECSASGFEKEGPVFRLGDIRKLKSSAYKIVNAQNSSVSYKVADYLDLRLFRAVKKDND
jgi:hypothetical protein